MIKFWDRLQQVKYSSAIFALGLTLMIAMIISPGSFVQEALFALVDLDAFTYYQAVHGEAINRSLPRNEWFQLALTPAFLAVAFAASAWAVTRRRRSGFLIAIWIIVATGLTITDVASAAQVDKITTNYVIKNVFSNLVGAAFVAGMAALSLGLTEKSVTNSKR